MYHDDTLGMAFMREQYAKEEKHADREPGTRKVTSNFRPQSSAGKVLPGSYDNPMGGPDAKMGAPAPSARGGAPKASARASAPRG